AVGPRQEHLPAASRTDLVGPEAVDHGAVTHDVGAQGGSHRGHDGVLGAAMDLDLLAGERAHGDLRSRGIAARVPRVVARPPLAARHHWKTPAGSGILTP